MKNYYRTYICLKSSTVDDFWKREMMSVIQSLYKIIYSEIKLECISSNTECSPVIPISMNIESNHDWTVVGIASSRADFGSILKIADQVYGSLVGNLFDHTPPFVKERNLITINPVIRALSRKSTDVELTRYENGVKCDEAYQGKYSRLNDANVALTIAEYKKLCRILNTTNMDEFCSLKEITSKVFQGL